MSGCASHARRRVSLGWDVSDTFSWLQRDFLRRSCSTVASGMWSSSRARDTGAETGDIDPLKPLPPASEFPAYVPRDFFRFELVHESAALRRVGRIHCPTASSRPLGSWRSARTRV